MCMTHYDDIKTVIITELLVYIISAESLSETCHWAVRGAPQPPVSAQHDSFDLL